LASYLIKSGRVNKSGKRNFDVVIPNNSKLHSFSASYQQPYGELIEYDLSDLLNMIKIWYEKGLELKIPEEELRYIKPQATEFKGIIGMNAHALIDWFKIRCCLNAQTEIRDLANKMLKLCKNCAPDLFKDAGASCRVLGYCPENKLQNKSCKRKIITHKEVLALINEHQIKKNILE